VQAFRPALAYPVVSADPNMLRSTLHQISSATNPSVWRRRPAAAQPEQGLKRRHRLPATIMSKHELVEVHLKLRLADAVIRADQPLLDVPDRAISQRHDRDRAAAERVSGRLVPRHVPDAGRGQSVEALERIGVQRRAWRDVVRDERVNGGLLHVRERRHSDATRGLAAFFDRDQHQRRFAPFQLAATTEARLRTTNPGVIHLDLAVQRLPRRVHHGAPQFVQQHPGGLVTTQPELALEQQRGQPAFVGHREVRRPEPCRQRRLRIVENRAGRQRDLIPTACALPAARPGDRVRASMATSRTYESVGPSTQRQIVPARSVARELPLEFGQILRKRRSRHAVTL